MGPTTSPGCGSACIAAFNLPSTPRLQHASTNSSESAAQKRWLILPIRITEGAYADILLVKGNPLEGTAILEDYKNNINLIMKDGVIYKHQL